MDCFAPLAMTVYFTAYLSPSQRLPHAQPQHEALPDLYGIAAGGADAGLVVDPCCDQRRPGSRRRATDQPLEVFFVGGPGAVSETATGGDGDNVRHRCCGGRL